MQTPGDFMSSIIFSVLSPVYTTHNIQKIIHGMSLTSFQPFDVSIMVAGRHNRTLRAISVVK